ncbi:hypothetical protein DPMN_044471 [Dreissena polymorpha]|uniref:Uncharacterized protein n=1 Tax=Dreissena polymorpha TaxID=45954 RepID=A0A9D4HYV3_DREPO|nr:hypothetical protein DPMN_044471 [Dreissena polymorpha]
MRNASTFPCLSLATLIGRTPPMLASAIIPAMQLALTKSGRKAVHGFVMKLA